MPVISINLKDFSKELGRFSNRHIDDIKRAVTRGILRSIPELVRNSPVDTGQYAGSWDYIEGDKAVTVGNFAPHAPIIEYGTRPYKPPITPLLQWAKRVLRDASQPPNYSNAVWNLAVGTQKKIAKYGQIPKHVMQRNIPVILHNIELELNRG